MGIGFIETEFAMLDWRALPFSAANSRLGEAHRVAQLERDEGPERAAKYIEMSSVVLVTLELTGIGDLVLSRRGLTSR